MTREAAPGVAAEDSSTYDPVAEAFERLTSRFSQPFADRLVRLAGVGSSDRVLDVGTGTGIVARCAAANVRPGGRVLGIDLAEGMLRVAAERCRAAGWDDVVEFQRMDATRLELKDESQDVVLSLYALPHFPDPLRALREMYRVLRQGGRLAVAVGSGPPFPSLAAIARGAARLKSLLFEWAGREASAPRLLNGLVERRLPERQGSLRTNHAGHGRALPPPRLAQAAGFRVLRTTWEGLGAELATPEEFWELQSTFSSMARKRLAESSPRERDAVREEFLMMSRDVQARGGRLVYRQAASFTLAERP